MMALSNDIDDANRKHFECEWNAALAVADRRTARFWPLECNEDDLIYHRVKIRDVFKKEQQYNNQHAREIVNYLQYLDILTLTAIDRSLLSPDDASDGESVALLSATSNS